MTRDHISGGIALIITENNDIEHMKKKIGEKTNVSTDNYDMSELLELAEIYGDYADIQATIGFSNSTYPFKNETDMTYPDRAVIIWADNNISPYETTYKNKEELIDEFKRKVKDFLPENFKYENNTGFVVFTSYY